MIGMRARHVLAPSLWAWVPLLVAGCHRELLSQYVFLCTVDGQCVAGWHCDGALGQCVVGPAAAADVLGVADGGINDTSDTLSPVDARAEIGSGDVAGELGALDSGPAPDVGADCSNTPRPPSCPCVTREDCDSGLCLWTSSGRRCAKQCTESCPGTLECTQVTLPSADLTYACVEPAVTLCMPCISSADCDVLGTGVAGLCVRYGDAGNFCGIPCDLQLPCPFGYECLNSKTVGGALVTRCVPESGQCTCRSVFETLKASTTCANTSEAGTCAGVRSCASGVLTSCTAATPIAEVCNGQDDDCDGQTDEGLASVPCTKQGEFGTCSGVTICAGGQLSPCSAVEPKPEACNAKDDDCDGKTDEGLCEDGEVCTADACTAQGACTHAPLCDDADACSADACHPITGACSYKPKCDDGDPCTTDACKNGDCSFTYACDDQNPCTVDVCNGVTGCSHTVKSCPLGLVCGASGQCECKSGTLIASKFSSDLAVMCPDTFLMGSPESEPGRDSDETQHAVTLTQRFALATREVSQSEWAAVMKTWPSYFSACGGTCPVERVSWFDAVTYLNALSVKESLSTCYILSGCTGTAGAGCASGGGCNGDYQCSVVSVSGCTGYRLPTEAEWEFAARGGTSGGTYAGTTAAADPKCKPPNSALDGIAWFCGNADDMTHAAGLKVSLNHPWGLLDVLGNVWEWTADWYGPYVLPAPPNPVGPTTGPDRGIRGGSWNVDASSLRSANREFSFPSSRGSNVGFRPARSLP